MKQTRIKNPKSIQRMKIIRIMQLNMSMKNKKDLIERALIGLTAIKRMTVFIAARMPKAGK